MKRYSAKILFQFRVIVNGVSGKRRFCEERNVLISARTAADALTKAKRRGEEGEFSYRNDAGNPIHFEFI